MGKNTGGSAFPSTQDQGEWICSLTDAAALIEGMRRRVPRAMLNELWEISWGSGGRGRVDGGKNAAINEIAAKHGAVIE